MRGITRHPTLAESSSSPELSPEFSLVVVVVVVVVVVNLSVARSARRGSVSGDKRGVAATGLVRRIATRGAPATALSSSSLPPRARMRALLCPPPLLPDGVGDSTGVAGLLAVWLVAPMHCRFPNPGKPLA